MNNLYYDGMFGWGFGGGLMMVFFWVFIIILIVWLVKWSRTGTYSESPNFKSALEVLKERYAKGEIDKKEFEEKSRDIKNS